MSEILSKDEIKRKVTRQVAKSMQQIEFHCDNNGTEEDLKREIKSNFWNLYEDIIGGDADYLQKNPTNRKF